MVEDPRPDRFVVDSRGYSQVIRDMAADVPLEEGSNLLFNHLVTEVLLDLAGLILFARFLVLKHFHSVASPALLWLILDSFRTLKPPILLLYVPKPDLVLYDIGD